MPSFVLGFEYTGRTHIWPGGEVAGIPFDIWQQFEQNKHLYIASNKPFPVFQNEVTEPDKSMWAYRFVFDSPINYYDKRLMTPPPAPGQPAGYTGGSIPGIGDPPDIDPITGKEYVPHPVNPYEPPGGATDEPPGGADIQPYTPGGTPGEYGDLIPLAGLAGLVLGMQARKAERRAIRKRRV